MLKNMFLKHDCNPQHPDTTGRESPFRWYTHLTQQEYVLYVWWKNIRSVQHDPRQEDPRERLWGLSGCHLGLLPWQPKHSHQSFPGPGTPVSPDSTTPFPLPASNLSLVLTRQLQIFLLTHHQAPTCVYSFPSGRLKPHHRPPGFSAVYLFHQCKQGLPNLPSHCWRKSSFSLNLQAFSIRLPSSASAVGSVLLVTLLSVLIFMAISHPPPATYPHRGRLYPLCPSQNQPCLSDNEQRLSSWRVGDGASTSIVNAINIMSGFCVSVVLVVA